MTRGPDNACSPFRVGIAALFVAASLLVTPVFAQQVETFYDWSPGKQNSYVHKKAVGCKKDFRLGWIEVARTKCYTVRGLIDFLQSRSTNSDRVAAWLATVESHVVETIDKIRAHEQAEAERFRVVVIESGVSGGGVATGSSGVDEDSDGDVISESLSGDESELEVAADAAFETAAGHSSPRHLLDTEVYFDLNSAGLTPENFDYLVRWARFARIMMPPEETDLTVPSVDDDIVPSPPGADGVVTSIGRIQITATTDPSGPSALNFELSRQRANSVADVFVRNGIPRDMITILPLGEGPAELIDPERPFNADLRRVTVTID